MLSPIHQRLKDATQTIHIEVETLSYVDEILNQKLSPTAYTSLLCTNYIFHTGVNRAIQEYLKASALGCTHAGYYEVQRYAVCLPKRIRALEQDLFLTRQNSLQSPQTSRLSLPQATNVLQVRSLSAAFGMMYVMEGSMLGGLVIHRALQKTPQLNDHQPFYFYSQFNAKVGERWKHFCTALATHITTREEQETAVTKAIETFNFFKAVLKYQRDSSIDGK